MTIANWCVLAACVLPVLTVGLAKANSIKLPSGGGRYNNDNPREWAKGLTGWQQRANAAQSNGFEILPIFISAIILAQQAHVDQVRIDNLAMAFVVLRLCYVAAYLMNVGWLRTVFWMGGIGICVGLFFMMG